MLGRALVILALLAGVASAQPVVSGGWRPPVGCSSGQVIQFNGTAWVCGTPTAFSTNNVIPKGNGTTLVASQVTDDGTVVGLLSSAFQFTRNADPIDGTTFHGRVNASSGIVGKAPWIIDTTRQMFNGTPDPVLAIGYNHLANGGKVQAGEHSLSWNLEADYNDGVNRTMEAYLSYKSADGLTEVRPLMVQFNRATNKVTGMNLGGGGPIYLHLHDSGTGGVEFMRGASSGRIRITGGSNELMQIGNIAGITTISMGPSSISGTAELVTTAGVVTVNGVEVINGSNNGVALTAVQLGASSRAIDVKKGSSIGAIRLAGGSNELMQIGSVSGITTVSIGPSAVSGTAELSLTATTATLTGSSTFGTTPGTNTHLFNGATTITLGTSTVAAAQAGTALTLTAADGQASILTMRGNGIKQIALNNANGLADGAINYDGSQARAMRFVTAGITRQMIDSAGTASFGDVVGAVDNNVDVITIGNTGTGQTASTALINASHTGSFNTTAGSVTYYGANISVSASKSAGSNTLQGVALRLSATNGDDPVGLLVSNGRAQFDGNVFTVNATTQRGLRNHIADTYFEWNDDWMSTLTQSGSGGTNTALVGGPMEYLSVVTGASTTNATISALAVSGRPGVVRFDTGTANNAALHRATSASLAVATSGTTHVYEAAVRFPTLSNATDGYAAMVGFFADGTNAPSGGNGCWIAYDERNVLGYNAGNQNKFICACNDTGALSTDGFRMDGTTVSSGGFTTVDAPVVANTWYKLRVSITNSVAEFYIDNTKRCQITGTALPDGALSAAGWAFKKSVGTTARQMDVDYTGLSMQLGAAR